MISICSLKKSFNNPVLNNFNYTFESKNIYHVIGRNGAGKTTLLKLIKGIYVPDFGEIVLRNNLSTHKDIVFIDNNYRSFFHRLNVMDNLSYFQALQNNNAMISVLNNLINHFELSALVKHKFSDLSQGQMQLISFIRGLSSNPRVILIDEGFSSLDKTNKEKVLEFILDYVEDNNALSIITSHESERILDQHSIKVEL